MTHRPIRATLAAHFQRARKPEEREVRRRAILKAARALATKVGPVEVSLNEVARKADLTKSNLYRYFESREEILLCLLVEELHELSLEVEAAFTAAMPLPEVAEVISRAFLSRPLLCRLLGVVASILEHNLTSDAIFRAKSEMLGDVGRVVEGLCRAVPRLGPEDAAFACQSIALEVAALYPAAYPSAAAAHALARPELAPLRVDAERDLPRFVRVLLNGFD